MLQLIYELRKNWRGRVDGTGRDGWRIEGSTRGPRGPKNNRAGDTLSHFPFLVDVASNLKDESHSQRFREFFNITYVSSLSYYVG